jgi:predicted ATPase
MQFFVERFIPPGGRSAAFPHVVLQHDPWNDFGYRTTFQLTLHCSRSRKVAVGEVKILRKGQAKGDTRLAATEFAQLPPDYCSLGVSFKYYTTLLEEGRELFESVLESLRDAAWNSAIADEFAAEPGFEISLIRTGGAQRVLEDVPTLLKGRTFPTVPSELTLQFQNAVGGGNFTIDFDFNTVADLPGRINVLIGYNGAGKTQLLANLAAVANETERRQDPAFRRGKGQFLGSQRHAFGAVITVSYSAFDTFDLPGRTAQEQKKLQERGEVYGFVYCGLRKRNPSEDPEAPYLLKDFREITRDLNTALTEIQRSKRLQSLQEALSPLTREASFGRIGSDELLRAGWSNVRRVFESASAGHRVVLNILVQLTAHLQNHSLVLIDEPESHLHPPLLAAFMRGLRCLLNEYDSFCVIATHSPVVLQETPRRYVRVLRRLGGVTTVARLENETFGENLGSIIREVFHLDSSSTDFHSVLDELLRKKRHLQPIEALFDGQLSSQGRAYLLSQMPEDD